MANQDGKVGLLVFSQAEYTHLVVPVLKALDGLGIKPTALLACEDCNYPNIVIFRTPEDYQTAMVIVGQLNSEFLSKHSFNVPMDTLQNPVPLNQVTTNYVIATIMQRARIFYSHHNGEVWISGNVARLNHPNNSAEIQGQTGFYLGIKVSCQATHLTLGAPFREALIEAGLHPRIIHLDGSDQEYYIMFDTEAEASQGNQIIINKQQTIFPGLNFETDIDHLEKPVSFDPDNLPWLTSALLERAMIFHHYDTISETIYVESHLAECLSLREQ